MRRRGCQNLVFFSKCADALYGWPPISWITSICSTVWEKVDDTSSLTTRYQRVCIFWLDMFFKKKKNSINIDILISHGVSINFNFDFRVSNQFRICFLLPAQAFSLTNSPLINFNLSTSLSLLINFIIIYQPDLSFFRALNLLICYILFHSIYYGYCVLWIMVTVYSVCALDWEVGR